MSLSRLVVHAEHTSKAGQLATAVGRATKVDELQVLQFKNDPIPKQLHSVINFYDVRVPCSCPMVNMPCESGENSDDNDNIDDDHDSNPHDDFNYGDDFDDDDFHDDDGNDDMRMMMQGTVTQSESMDTDEHT